MFGIEAQDLAFFVPTKMCPFVTRGHRQSCYNFHLFIKKLDHCFFRGKKDCTAHHSKITVIAANRWTSLQGLTDRKRNQSRVWFRSNCSSTEVLPGSRQIKNLLLDPLKPFNKSKSFKLTPTARVLHRTGYGFSAVGRLSRWLQSSFPHLSGWKRRDGVSSGGKNHIKDVHSPKNMKHEY